MGLFDYPQALADEANFALSEAQTQAFVDVFKINIDCIIFDQRKTIDLSNVKRLRRVFQLQGCLRYERENFLAAIADEPQLQQLQKFNDKNAIHYVENFLCLFGQHRILAAKKCLPEGQRWWSVDIYRRGKLRDADRLSKELEEKYDNAEKPLDGDIFRNIRDYTLRKDFQMAQKWWARLSKSKSDDLKQLENDGKLLGLFDELLQVTGLWGGIKLGRIHRLLNIRCTEECREYLGRIKECWGKVLNGVDGEFVDNLTVDRLQTLDPRDAKDKKKIKKLMRAGEIFKNYDDKDKERIIENIKAWNGEILSFFSFLEDLKYLEACTRCLKFIFPIRHGQTMEQVAFGSWIESNKVSLQTTESVKLATIPTTLAPKKVFYISYCQLWLFAMRHFPALALPPKRDPGCKKPETGPPNAWCLDRLCHLAKSLGFTNPSIEARLRENPYAASARRILLEFSIGEDNNTSTPEYQNVLTQIETILRTYSQTKIATGSPREDSEDSEDEAKSRRCGRPFSESHKRCSWQLFLRNLALTRREPEKYRVTALEVRRNFFVNFWGSKIDNDVLKVLSSFNITRDLEVDMRDLQPEEADQESDLGYSPYEIDDVISESSFLSVPQTVNTQKIASQRMDIEQVGDAGIVNIEPPEVPMIDAPAPVLAIEPAHRVLAIEAAPTVPTVEVSEAAEMSMVPKTKSLTATTELDGDRVSLILVLGSGATLAIDNPRSLRRDFEGANEIIRNSEHFVQIFKHRRRDEIQQIGCKIPPWLYRGHYVTMLYGKKRVGYSQQSQIEHMINSTFNAAYSQARLRYNVFVIMILDTKNQSLEDALIAASPSNNTSEYVKRLKPFIGLEGQP